MVDGVRYGVFQLEQGEAGTVHYQGYIEMHKPVKFTHFNDELPGAHFEIARGTPGQCIEYCTKPESRLEECVEIGTRPKSAGSRGSRSDLLALRDAVKSGKRVIEIFDDDELISPAIKYVRGLDRMLDAYSKPVDRPDFECFLHYGPAGTGKSHYIRELSPDAFYMDGNGNGFWLNYRGERICVLDDFSGCVLKPIEFQRLCDKYPYMLNIKGSQMPCNVRTVRISSNYAPNEWWSEKTRYHKPAIYRRISTVFYHYAYRKAYRFDSINNADQCAAARLEHFLYLEKTPVMMAQAIKNNELLYDAELEL